MSAQPKPKTKPSFQWDDPLLLEAQLTPDERQVRDAARDFAQNQLAPRIVSAFREERFDRDIISEMGARGLLGRDIAAGVWRRRREPGRAGTRRARGGAD